MPKSENGRKPPKCFVVDSPHYVATPWVMVKACMNAERDSLSDMQIEPKKGPKKSSKICQHLEKTVGLSGFNTHSDVDRTEGGTLQFEGACSLIR